MGIQDRKWQQEMMEYQTQMAMLQELIGILGSVGGAYLGGLGTPAGQLTPPAGALPSRGKGAYLPLSPSVQSLLIGS